MPEWTESVLTRVPPRLERNLAGCCWMVIPSLSRRLMVLLSEGMVSVIS